MSDTDINTRTSWYSQTVSCGTTADGGRAGLSVWSGDIGFPRIQGADMVGRIAAVGAGVEVNEEILGEPLAVIEI